MADNLGWDNMNYVWDDMSYQKRFESSIMGDIYDYLFDNYTDIDFKAEFPNAEVDYVNARIYLGDFVLKIERVAS